MIRSIIVNRQTSGNQKRKQKVFGLTFRVLIFSPYFLFYYCIIILTSLSHRSSRIGVCGYPFLSKARANIYYNSFFCLSSSYDICENRNPSIQSGLVRNQRHNWHFSRNSKSDTKLFSTASTTNTERNMPCSSVVVVGSANVDLTAYTSHRLPCVGETILGNQFTTTCGGKGANQAVAAASLGIPGVQVSMICKVGSDSYGDMLLKNFRNRGVNVKDSSQSTDGCSTGIATIVVEQNEGDNMIVVVPGANGQLTPNEVENRLKESVNPPDIVVSQLEIELSSVKKAFEVAKTIKKDCITILNPSPIPSEPLNDDFYLLTDILIVNEGEARSLTADNESLEDHESMARSLLSKGIGKAVVITTGAKGAIIVDKSGTVSNIPVPSLPCDNLPVLDTVGAGDAFCGAMASYLGFGLSVEESAEKACGVASMSVRKMGAQCSYPTRQDLPDELIESLDSAKHETKKLKEFNVPPITFVTGNKKKLEEVQRMLVTSGSIPFKITNRKIDLPELQGEVDEIAIEKCKLAAKEVGGPVMTEDTSLCFNALKGLPGPYIKWFLEKCGHDGLNGLISGSDDKTAYAQTMVAFCPGPGQDVKLFDGRTHGNIVPARGPLDFGWDPIFEPNEGGGLTYAEMEKDAKNLISHRGRSFAKFRDFLKNEELSILKKMGSS